MDKIKKERDNLNLFKEKLYNIEPGTAGSSIVADSTALFFLEFLESSNPKKLAHFFKNFLEKNLKYSYNEAIDVIESVIIRCNEYIKNNSEFDLRIVSDKYLKFIDEFNSYDLKYKIKKDLDLEVNQLEIMQKRIISNVESINTRYDEISDRLEKINYDFIGTISLFIGVIFAIYGGFELCTSIFNFIGKVEFKYLIIALIILGYIEFSILSLLVHVIFMINHKDTKNIFYFNGFNSFLMLISILSIYFFVK